MEHVPAFCFITAIALFAISAFISPTEPWWRRVLSIGLAFVSIGFLVIFGK